MYYGESNYLFMFFKLLYVSIKDYFGYKQVVSSYSYTQFYEFLIISLAGLLLYPRL